MIQSMGLTSVFYNGVQVPPKFDSSFLRVSPTSPPLQPPKSSRIQFSQFHFHTSHSVRNRFRRGYCLPIACSRGTEQEEWLSNSEGDIPGSRSSHGINNVETSHITSSSNLKENKGRPEIYASSVRAVALCVCTAVAFGIGLGLKDGVGKASEFFAGYLLEQSLSVDNLFVFVLIFKYFKVPIMYQSKVLSYGIAGAIVFRLSIILLGTATLQRFEAVNLLLAAILLYSSFKLRENSASTSFGFYFRTTSRLRWNYQGLQDKIKLVAINLQNRPAWYKEKVYPENKVPSLEHNNKVIGESLDLLKYIDSNFEGPSLLPNDPAKRQFAEEMLSYSDTVNKTVFTSFKGDPAKETGGVFDYLETALHKFDDGPFFLGQFSMVDMAYVPFIERFQLLMQDVWKYDIMAG